MERERERERGRGGLHFSAAEGREEKEKGDDCWIRAIERLVSGGPTMTRILFWAKMFKRNVLSPSSVEDTFF